MPLVTVVSRPPNAADQPIAFDLTNRNSRRLPLRGLAWLRDQLLCASARHASLNGACVAYIGARARFVSVCLHCRFLF